MKKWRTAGNRTGGWRVCNDSMIARQGYTYAITDDAARKRSPLSAFERRRRIGGYPAVKRISDIVISACVITGILSWLLPVLAVIIKWDSPGPLFFVQRRAGRRGKVFTCYKLRTMVVNDLADSRPTLVDDERITRVGAILRRLHLDELPQLFNVLSGAMSLVGPRPYMLSEHFFYAEKIPGYIIRHDVKPGITGLAQVMGLHGLSADLEKMTLRCQWDEFYVRHAGVRMDIHILNRTIRFFIKQMHS